jgi:hypothetical protein
MDFRELFPLSPGDKTTLVTGAVRSLGREISLRNVDDH